MKNKIYLAVLLTFCIFYSDFCKSQFGITPATGGAFGRTIVGISGVGIGNFAAGANTLSAFHINTNLTSPTTFFTPNQVFRTTSLTDGYWKMFTGANNGT